jgi:hypothetical protein
LYEFHLVCQEKVSQLIQTTMSTTQTILHKWKTFSSIEHNFLSLFQQQCLQPKRFCTNRKHSLGLSTIFSYLYCLMIFRIQHKDSLKAPHSTPWEDSELSLRDSEKGVAGLGKAPVRRGRGMVGRGRKGSRQGREQGGA